MLDNASITLTVSAGVAADIGGNLDELINEADKFLYNAKMSGRNQIGSE